MQKKFFEKFLKNCTHKANFFVYIYRSKNKSSIYANGLKTEYVYNDLELLIEVWYTVNGVRTKVYEYENTGRFISPDRADVICASPNALTDKNLYSYCDNNPVMRRDDGGQFWDTLFDVKTI